MLKMNRIRCLVIILLLLISTLTQSTLAQSELPSSSIIHMKIQNGSNTTKVLIGSQGNPSIGRSPSIGAICDYYFNQGPYTYTNIDSFPGEDTLTAMVNFQWGSNHFDTTLFFVSSDSNLYKYRIGTYAEPCDSIYRVDSISVDGIRHMYILDFFNWTLREKLFTLHDFNDSTKFNLNIWELKDLNLFQSYKVPGELKDLVYYK